MTVRDNSDHTKFLLGLRVANEVLGHDLPQDLKVEPAVVLGHSGVGGKEGLIALAAHFAREGFAAFAIAYRSFGDSHGEPCGGIWPEKAVGQQTRRPASLPSNVGIDGAGLAAAL